MNIFEDLQKPKPDYSYLFQRENPVLPATDMEAMRAAAKVGLLAGEQQSAAAFQELRTTGKSDTVQSILLDSMREQADQLRAQAENLAADRSVPSQQKVELMRETALQMEVIPMPTLTDLVQRKAAVEASTDSANAEQIQNMIASKYDKIVQAERAPINGAQFLTMDGGPVRQVLDLTASAFIPGRTWNIAEVIDEAFPGFVSWNEYFPYPMGGGGDLVVRFKGYLNTLSPDERDVAIKKLAKAIDENNLLTSNNQYQKYDLMSTLTDDLTPGNWERTIENIFSVLDVLPVVGAVGDGLMGLARKAFKSPIAKAFDAKAQEAASGLGSQPFKKRPNPTDQKGIWVYDAVRKVYEYIDNLNEIRPSGSTASAVVRVAPREGQRLLKAAVEDETGKAAEAVGTTREQITADDIMPKQEGSTSRPFADLNDINDTVVDYKGNLGFLTDEEIKSHVNLVEDTLRQTTPNAIHSRMEVSFIPGGYVGRMFISDTTTHGYSTFQLAEDTAKSFHEYDPATTRILARKLETDEYVPVEQAKKEGWFDPEEGDFVVQLDVVEMLDHRAALANTGIFHENSLVGKAAAWVDKSATFLGWLTSAGNIASDLESAKIKALNQTLKPLTKLWAKDQQKVISVLDQGDRETKWFTTEDLADIWKDEKNVDDLIAGYRSAVRHQQLVRRLLNDRTRSQLVADGWKHVVLPRGQFQEMADQLGKQVSISDLKVRGKDYFDKDIEANVSRIYDSELNRMVKTDIDEISKLIDANPGNIKIIELQKPVKVGKEWTKFVLYKEGKGVEFKKLPDEVIRDIPGYISRIYDAPYILKVEYNSLVNGVRVKGLKAVRMYATKGEALRDKARLDLEYEANKNSVYEDLGLPLPERDDQVLKYMVTEAKELQRDIEYANRTSLEYLENSGQLFTSHRGVEVKGLNGKRRLKSVSDSMAAARARAARAGTIDPLVDKLKANWDKKYGKDFGVNGQMPLETSQIRRPTEVTPNSERAYQEAVAFQRHITHIAGIDETMFSAVSRSTAINLSNYLSRYDNVWLNQLAEGVMRNRHRNLINAAKGANFTVRIIFNPLRQLPLQAMQMSIYLGLDHGAKYFLSKQGMNDYLGLIYGTMWRNTDQWEQFGLKQGAKLMGVSEAEYTKFIDIYQRHGLPASVDSHMYAIFANVDRVVGKAPVYQGAVNTFNTFRKYARRIGFDAGEQFQLMGAFLAVRNKWMKNNPKIAHKWAEPGNIEKIFGEARVVSYNMNKTGAMQFQKGILGLIFQFQAHAVKSMQTLLPNEFKLLGDKTNTAYKRTIGKLSNKAFSDAEKARIAWQQFALFGTGAYGVGQMWDKFQETTGVDTPPEVDRSIREGITGTLLNMLFEAWNQDGEQMADIEFSGNAAPFSGISGRNQVFGTGNPIAAFLTGIVLEDKTSLEFGLGPSYALGKDVYEAWKFTTAALGTPFEPISGPEKGIVVANEWMKTFFPIYGNFMRGRVALELNRYVAATGDVGAEVTTGEAMALGTMGLNAHSNRWLQDELIQIKGLIGNPKQDKLGAEIDAEAANFYKFLKAHAELLGEGKLDPVEGTRLVELNAQMLSDALSDDEHRRFFNRVRDLILNDVTKDGLETQFINAVISGYAAYIPDIRDPEFINRIRSGPEFSTKEETIKFLEEMNQWQRIDQNPQM